MQDFSPVSIRTVTLRRVMSVQMVLDTDFLVELHRKAPMNFGNMWLVVLFTSFKADYPTLNGKRQFFRQASFTFQIKTFFFLIFLAFH